VSDRGLSREVAALRERIGPVLCADPAPCRINATTETVLLPGGAEERHGTPPPPLCASCPQHEERRRPVRWVEIVKDCRSLHHGEADEVAASAATLRDSGTNRGLVGRRTQPTTQGPTAAPEPEPEDDLPASWPADHPARLGLEGHEPEPPRRRGEEDAAIRMDPSEFGL
jgi:hypothetical protein